MQRAKKELGLKIATEVASEKHVFECLKYGVDLVWLGARTTANPFLVQEIADARKDVDIPVLVKNPVNADIDLWIGALERLNAAGVRKLGVIHRGFSAFQKSRYRNPFFCDPSHLAGKRDYIQEISQRSLDLGLEGLMIESHCDPTCALSDAGQQLLPADLENLLYHQLVVRENDSDNLEYKENIDLLRSQIDVIDENLLNMLASRMKVSRKIGEYKRDNNIAILQASRWDSILEEMIRKGADNGLDEKFITAVFNAIHEASVRVQNEILENQASL